MMAEVIGLPAWNHNAGICWRCRITLDEIHQVGEDSPWRLPENRLSHGDLLRLLQARGPLCKIFDFPGFNSKLFRIDWLHCADLGISAKMFGAILHLSVGMARYGPNQHERVTVVWARLLAWYDIEGVTCNRLKSLPLKRFKQQNQRPCLKASAGQIRALVPWFLAEVRSWTLEDFKPQLHRVVQGVKRAMEHLAMCYQCLSSAPGFAEPLGVLKRQSIMFAQDLVALAELDEGRFSTPPPNCTNGQNCVQKAAPPQSPGTTGIRILGGVWPTWPGGEGAGTVGLQ